MLKFLEAQKKEPKRKDWYSKVQEILEEFDIQMTVEYITNTSSKIYNNIVKKKAVIAGIEFLKAKQLKDKKEKRSNTLIWNCRTN